MKKAQPAAKTTNKSLLQNPMLQFIIALIVVFALYGKSVNFGYVLDDDLVFTNASVKQGVSAIPQIFSEGYLDGFNGQSATYRPLVLASFAIAQSLHGNNPRMNHIVHLLLYAALCWVLLQLLQAWFQQIKPLVLLIAMLIFLAHPIHTEVICNLKSRDELLAALFVVSSLFCLTNYQSAKSNVQLVLSLIFALLAMLSKETAFMLILIVPLAFYAFQRSDWRKIAIATGMFSLPLALVLFMRHAAIGGTEALEPQFVINNAFVNATIFERIATSAYLFWIYALKSFVPINLTWDYSFSTLSLVTVNSLAGLLSILGVLALLVFSVLKFKTERVIVFSVIGFALFLIPVLNLFVLIGANFAERFLFIPSLFSLVLLIALSQRFNGIEKLVGPIFGGILMVYSLQTIARIPDWESNETLFEASLKTNPESARVQNAVGTIYRQKAENMPPSPQQEAMYKKAISHFDEAVNILPETFEALYNKGVIYQSTGRPDLAEKLFEQVLDIDSNYVDALNNLGVIKYNLNEFEAAEMFFNRAFGLHPNHPRVVANIGLIAYKKGNFEEAKKYFARSLELNPNQENVRKNLELLRNSK